MGVNENLYVEGDVMDYASETVKTGLAGAAAGILHAIGDSAPAEVPLGASSTAKPTAVSAADAAGAGDVEVTFTKPSGIDSVDIVVVNPDGTLNQKVKGTTSPKTVSGLTAGEEYTVRVRSVADDERLSIFAADVTVTPS